MTSLRRMSQWAGAVPLWVRFAFAVLLLAALPAVVGVVFVEAEVRSLDRDKLEIYLEDLGRRTRANLTENLDRTVEVLATFEERQRSNLLWFLAFDARTQVIQNDLNNDLNNRVVGSGLFTDVRIVSPDGVVMLASEGLIAAEEAGTPVIGADETEAPTFRTFRNAVELGDPWRWTTEPTAGGDVLVELVYVIPDTDDTPLGYIVGTISQPNVFYNILQPQTNFIDYVAYVVTSDDEVIATPEGYERALAAAEGSPVAASRTTGLNLSSFEINGRDTLGFFAPLENTPLVLVIHAPIEANFFDTLTHIYDQGIVLVFLQIGIGAVLLVVVLQSLIAPLRQVRSAVDDMTAGDFESELPAVDRADIVGDLARSVVSMRAQLGELISAQASQIQDRVRDLQATQQVSRFAVTQATPEALMTGVVERIVASFPNIYHAQIFLLDGDGRYALLQASTGEAGRQLLARGHRLRVGGVSVIGQVTGDRRVVIARDTSESDVHRPNVYLPETRAELAIPLAVGEQLVGALDVQSKQSDSFTEDQVSILQTMADQVAMAIVNTRLYQESLRQLEELGESRRSETQSAWTEYLRDRRQPMLTVQAGVALADDGSGTLEQQAILHNEPVVGALTERDTIAFAVPISLRGQVLGAARWELPHDDFSQDKVNLAQELVNRLAVSLDNARLFQQSQQAANRERLVSEITARLTGQTDIDSILQTAVREVGRALRAPRVTINLHEGGERAAGNGKRNGHRPGETE